jgi:ribose-phosphate pyrophosphokinase
MQQTPLILYLEDEQHAATQLAELTGWASARIERHRFPDGELKLRLPASVPERVVLLRSLSQPNEKLLEVLLAVHTARAMGAQHVSLVAPYLAYMRQDMAFVPGEAVSQRIVGQFLASMLDALVTVDPHLHRIATLQEVIDVPSVTVLSGAPLLGDWIAQQRQHPLLVGPDSESAQWVAQAALPHGFDHAVCHKVRHGDHAVDIVLPEVDVRARQVVLLDDMASSGRTLAGAARQLLAAGAARVDVGVTHALFAADALTVMSQAGVSEVWSTDCVAHASNVVSVMPAIAQALSRAP